MNSILDEIKRTNDKGDTSEVGNYDRKVPVKGGL